MDMNINELPERKGEPLDPVIVEMAMTPPPQQNVATTLKVGAFLAVVIVLTALAINSHHVEPGQSTAASDTPAAATSTPLPSAAAPTERTTTGAAAHVPAPPTGNSQ